MTAIVKVTLRDGVSHEDVGYGMLDNCRQKGMALDKVRFPSPDIPWYYNKLFYPVQERSCDGRVEAHTP